MPLQQLLETLSNTANPCDCNDLKFPAGGTQIQITSQKKGIIEQAASLNTSRSMSINLAGYTYSQESIKTFLNDLSAIQRIVKKDSRSFLKLVKYTQSGDIDNALFLSRKMKLTEKELKKNDGGWGPFIIAILAIAIVISYQQPLNVGAEPQNLPPLELDEEDIERAKKILDAIGNNNDGGK